MVRRSALRYIDRQFAGEIFPRQRIRTVHDVGGRALRDDVAAMDARARTDIQHVIGEPDGVFVVLDDNHGVAEVAQPLQCFQQACVVALMQADRGLIQHVQHPGQARADL